MWTNIEKFGSISKEPIVPRALECYTTKYDSQLENSIAIIHS